MRKSMSFYVLVVGQFGLIWVTWVGIIFFKVHFLAWQDTFFNSVFEDFIANMCHISAFFTKILFSNKKNYFETLVRTPFFLILKTMADQLAFNLSTKIFSKNIKKSSEIFPSHEICLSVKNLRKFWRFLNKKFKLKNVIPAIECSESILFEDFGDIENFVRNISLVYECIDGNELICA